MAIKIKITSDDLIDDIKNPLSAEKNTSKEPFMEKVTGKLGNVETALIKFGIDQATTWAMEGVKTYTSFTGNSMLQQKLDNSISLINIGLSIGAAFVANPSLGFIAMAGYGAQAGLSRFRSRVEALEAERTQSFIQQGMGKRNISGGQYGA